MIRRRRSRFDDLVARQLELFAADERALLAEIANADAAWTRAGRDEAEEAYGDYQLAVDAASDRLLEIREAYASTLDEPADGEYRAAFSRAVGKRFRRLPTLLSDLDA
ncbi:MAG TPA: hypothetical protein VH950_12020 [Gaiellaceae bacterium]